ncbi:Uncharacterized protein XB16_2822 [Leptospira santarosai]|uniref:Uncharacterized protein n=1 Tax=Leptospira santarosai TaxID=28183 RepID=A0A2P1QW31_9LEPT|nr:Uncharacterized protein XB16_2822 [Leptospira santarosai]
MAYDFSDVSEELFEQVKEDMIESFGFYGNPEYTGNAPALPVSAIIFGAPGPVVNPPSYEFMGYGQGPQGTPFEETGGFDLNDLINTDPSDDDEEETFNRQFQNACRFLMEILKQTAGSKEFQKIPKVGPIVFALSIEDQANQLLGRIHPDGTYEEPPAGK